MNTSPPPRVSRDSLELYSDYAAPKSAAEEKLIEIWSEIFEVDGLGIDDDFFDLGGNSVNATRLTAEITKAFGVKFMVGKIVECPTIRQIAELVKSNSEPELPSHVFALQTGGDRTPLFLVHGAAGFFFPHTDYMRGFHDDQPIYAFQVPGYDGQVEPFETISEIADAYIDALHTICPEGPWHLAGMCSGAWITYEMARKLIARGLDPQRIILIDPFIEEGKMRDQYELSRRDNSNGPLAHLAYWNTRFKSWRRDLDEKIRCWRATGHWIDPMNDQVMKIPEVREWVMDQRLQFVGQHNLDVDGLQETFQNESLINSYRSESGVYASEKLRRAFHKYQPDTPITNHIDIIASEFLNERLSNPLNPIRKLMPNHSVVLAGKGHMDTVSTNTSVNSEIMQRLMNEPIG